MQYAHYLHLTFQEFSELSIPGFQVSPIIFSPDSGGRFSTIQKNFESQVPHYDYIYFGTGGYQNGMKNPSYSAILIGTEGAPLWVLEGFYRFIYLDAKEVSSESKSQTLPHIDPPLWSALFDREYSIHADTTIKWILKNIIFSFMQLKENFNY